MTTITVEISEHAGIFYATSEEMPGFLLCSSDKQNLDADILPAMKALFAVKERFSKKSAIRKVSQRLVERVELAVAA